MDSARGTVPLLKMQIRIAVLHGTVITAWAQRRDARSAAGLLISQYLCACILLRHHACMTESERGHASSRHHTQTCASSALVSANQAGQPTPHAHFSSLCCQSSAETLQIFVMDGSEYVHNEYFFYARQGCTRIFVGQASEGGSFAIGGLR